MISVSQVIRESKALSKMSVALFPVVQQAHLTHWFGSTVPDRPPNHSVLQVF